MQPLHSDKPVIVYLDLKSPYAYLSIVPTRRLERELAMEFDWRPFVLDIPSYLGSARLGTDGEVVQSQRSAAQWAGVKYAYADCRRYAKLQGATIRGTEKIWDTELAAVAMLWARSQGRDVLHAFLDAVFPPFWVRSFDAESEATVAAVFDSIGSSSTDFLTWAYAEGFLINADLQRSAFGEGVFGVPTYVFNGEIFFGREHLPRLRWHLTGEYGSAPDIANTFSDGLYKPVSLPSCISVGVDDSADSLLALPRIARLLTHFPGEVSWYRLPTSQSEGAGVVGGDHSRGVEHLRLRAAHAASQAARYAGTTLAGAKVSDAIDKTLVELGVACEEVVPAPFDKPPLPGIMVCLDEELFVGRQHLPLLSERVSERL